jgi:hypothetical protein
MNNDSHGALHLPLNYNPRANLWGHLASNAIVGYKLEYFKLVEWNIP